MWVLNIILKNIRVLRIKRCETIIDMAEKLNMPIWRLSAIENGRIDMPDDFLKNLFEIYNFTLEEKEQFVTEKLLLSDEEIRKYMEVIQQ